MPRVVFNNKYTLREFRDCDFRLRQIILRLIDIWPVESDIVVTCIHRTWEEDRALGGSGVHAVGPPYRAADIRIRNLAASPVEYHSKAERLCAAINRVWAYDNDRPHLKVALCKPHGTGPHIHLQIHPHTEKRA